MRDTCSGAADTTVPTDRPVPGKTGSRREFGGDVARARPPSQPTSSVFVSIMQPFWLKFRHLGLLKAKVSTTDLSLQRTLAFAILATSGGNPLCVE